MPFDRIVLETLLDNLPKLFTQQSTSCNCCHGNQHTLTCYFSANSSHLPNAHRARATVEYLCQVTTDLISSDLWPRSDDLNPVDYRIWGCLRGRV